MTVNPITSILERDTYLSPFSGTLEQISRTYQDRLAQLIESEGSLDKFSKRSLGFTVSGKWITYREWAPNAVFAALVGDFSEFLG